MAARISAVQQVNLFHKIHICDDDGPNLQQWPRRISVGFLVAISGLLLPADSILQVVMQPSSLWVQAHLFVCLQPGNNLEGAVRCVDELEISDKAPWDPVDCRAAVASLHQTDGLCL